MKRKNYFFRALTLLALLLVPWVTQAQETLTVADGTTTNSYIPFYGYNADGTQQSQFIYPASMLTSMRGNAISQVQFFTNATSGQAYNGAWKLKLGICENATFSSVSYDATTITTEVYYGTLTRASDGTITIVFDNPFIYNDGNLLFDLRNYTGGAWNSTTFYGVTSTGSSLESTTGNTNTNGTQRNFLPKTTFTYAPPPSCITPSGINISSITATGAMVSWTSDASNFVVAYGTGTDPDQMTTFNATTTSANLTGLAANTSYNVYVKAVCSDDDQSAWSSVATFRTACEAVAITANDPYTYGFEDATGSGSSYAISPCWLKGTNSTTAYPYPSTTKHEGTYSLYFYGYKSSSSANYSYAVLPEITNNLNTLQLKLWMQTSYMGKRNRLIVGVVTDVADITTFTPVDTLSCTATGAFQQVEMDFSGYTGENGRIVLYVPVPDTTFSSSYSSATSTIYVDDIEVSLTPACKPIASIATSNVTRTSMDIAWTPKAGVTNCEGYQLVISPTELTDDDLADATPISVTATSYSATNLERNTTYYIYVRSNCGTADGYSVWASTEVKTKSLEDCSKIATVADGTTTHTNTPLDFYNTDGTSLHKAQFLYPASLLAQQVISSEITSVTFYDKSGATKDLTAAWTVKIGTTTETDLSAGFCSDQLAQVYNGLYSINSGIVTFEFDDHFDYTGGNLVVEISCTGTSYNWYGSSGGTGYYGVDGIGSTYSTKTNYTNFLPKTTFGYCETVEACPAVTGVAVADIAQTTANLSWTASTGDYANTYDVLVSTSQVTDFTSVTPTYTGITATTKALSGLTAYTDYYVYVRCNCNGNNHDDGNSEWVEFTFKTLSNCVTPVSPAVVATGKTTATASWTDGAAEQENSFQYILSTTEVNDFENATPTATGITATSVDLTDLTPGATYYFYVANYCGTADGLSPYVSTTFTMPFACPAVVNLTASNVAFNAATLTWNRGQFGEETSWEVGIVGNESNAITVTDSTAIIFGLTANAANTVYVKAICSSESQSAVTTQTITTPAQPGNCVIIADGTATNQYLPVYGLYCDSPQETQSIYPASMLTNLQGKTITSLKYYVSSGSSSNWEDGVFTVKMGVVDQTTLSSLASTSAMTTVYTGTLSASEATGMEINLSQSFVYNGGNLMIDFSLPEETGYTSCNFYGTSSTNSSYYAYDSYGSTSGGVQSFLPKVQFCCTPEACPQVANLAASNVTTNSARVSWYPGGSETSWQVISSDVSMTADDIAAADGTPLTVTTTTQELTDLVPDKDVYYYVRGICDAEADPIEVTDWKGLHFITAPSCSAPATAVASNYGNGSVTLTVTAGEAGTPESYTYQIWPEGATATDTVIVSAGTATQTVDDLPTFTLYHWRVKANCGTTDGLSRWTNGNDFYMCGTFAVTETTPYTNNFNDETLNAKPSCWNVLVNSSNLYIAGAGDNSSAVDMNTQSLKFGGGASITTPELSIPAGGAKIAFKLQKEGSSSGSMKVGFTTDLEDQTDYQLLATFNPTTEDVYVESSCYLYNDVATTGYVVFTQEGTSYWYYWIDDLSITTPIPEYTVTATASPAALGTVAITPDANTNGKYYEGKALTITPAETGNHYYFAKWTNAAGTQVSTTNPLAYTVNKDTAFIAVFDTNLYTLNITADANGTAVGSAASMKYGATAITATATADEHYHFTGWYSSADVAVSTVNPLTVSLVSDSALTAKFAIDQHALTLLKNVDSMGTVTDAGTYDYGSVLTIVATPATAHHFLHWNDGNTNASRSITLEGDTTFTAYFAIDTIEHTPDVLTGCDSVLWTANGQYYKAEGKYTYQHVEADGLHIDSVNVQSIKASTHNVITEVACDSYTWADNANHVYTTSTTDTRIYMNADNCSSVDTLKLTVNYSTHNVTVDTACDTYTWAANSQAYTASNTYTYNYTNSVNCASTDTLKLVVKNSTHNAATETACDTYTWTAGSGLAYTATGNYTHDYTNAVGCPSTDTLHLTIYASTHNVTTENKCDTYTWAANGTAYTASGDYVYNYLNAVQCPSADTLHLTIRYSTDSTLTVSACDSYTWTLNSTTYTESTAAEQFTLINAAGCDSVVTLNLTIRHSSTGIADTAACETFTWIDGNTYTASNNTATYTLTNAAGCDSVVTLKLAVYYNATTDTTVVACDSYFWQGTTYFISGKYANTYAIGTCIGTDSLHLTINKSTTGTDTKTACDSYTWNGTAYTTTGTYVDTLVNAANCDSIVTMTLTINYSNTGNDSQVACDSYSWNGTAYTTTGIYVDTLTNAANCDSVVTMNLTVNYSNTGSDSQVACDSYSWNGTAYTTTGIYVDTLTNAANCDSVVTMDLTINYSTTGTDTKTACDSYTWNGTAYTTTGTYVDTLVNAANCDSIVTMTLTINNSINTTDAQTACDTYTWNDNTYTASGVYVDTLETVLHCDSIVTMTLTINYSNTGTDSQVACDSYTWNGTAYTTTGIYVDTLTNAANCDSVVTMDLTINYSTTGTDSQVACDTYTWNGVEYTATGIYVDTLTNAANCDSVVTMNLTINYSNTGTDSQVACDSYNWNGTNYTSTGVYTQTLTNAANCDSVVTMNLTINNSIATTDAQTACDTYTWNGTAYTTSGVYVDTLATTANCDSVVTMTLTINYSNTGTDSQVACDTYTWNGVEYTATGIYVDTLTNAANCDSVVTMNLTVNYSIATTDNATACDTYTWNGNEYTVSGEYVDTLATALGCDSIVTMTLTINNSYAVNDMILACDSLTWIDGITYYENNNTATYTLTAANNCDSVVTLNLTIRSANGTSTTATACDAYMWHGLVYPVSDTYYFNFEAGQCTGTDTLILTINNSVIIDTAVTSCYAHTHGTTTYTNYGSDMMVVNITDSLQTVNGCDSIMNWTINISPLTYGIVTETACDSYTWNLTGTTYTTSSTDIYVMNHQNVFGCDSVVNLNLTINYSNTGNDNQIACDSLTWLDGITYYEDNDNATYTATNAAGCDSVITLNLTVRHSVGTTYYDTVCNGRIWRGMELTTSGIYVDTTVDASAACSGVDTLVLVVNYPTSYDTAVTSCYAHNHAGITYTNDGNTVMVVNVTDTLQNANGCDSLVKWTITINPLTYGELTEVACESFTWNLNGTTYTTSAVDTAVIVHGNANGCDSIVTLNLTINYGSHNTENQVACGSYTWHGQEYTATGVYTYAYNNENGCASIDTLNLYINQGEELSFDTVVCGEFTYALSQYGLSDITLTESVDSTFIFTMGNGCSLTLDLNIVVNQPVTNTTVQYWSIYDGDFLWTLNGQYYGEEGIYEYVVDGQNGECDTTYVLDLRFSVAEEIDMPKIYSHLGKALKVDMTLNGVEYYTHYQWYKKDTNSTEFVAVGDDNPTYAEEGYPYLNGCFYVKVTIEGYGEYASNTLCLVNGSVGIDDVEFVEATCTVAPNPARSGSQLTITTSMNEMQLQGATLMIYDLQGRVVLNQRMQQNTVSVRAPETSGVYTVRILTADGNSTTKKVVVK